MTPILESGTTIGGFRIAGVIGVGGMAVVYRAEQLSLRRPVALKLLAGPLTHDEAFRARFRREGHLAAALEHPNIIAVYDSGEADGHLYLAMRLIEGPTLSEHAGGHALSTSQTLAILSPIADALDVAHAAGLVHRDVKPQNILIAAGEHPYLADFGIAKSSTSHGLTDTGRFVGSVNYASPEQIRGELFTPASDIYALTGVLYHCLTGHVPYLRETEAGVMHAHLTQPPPRLSAENEVPSAIDAVIAQGMAKDATERYACGRDLMTGATEALRHLDRPTSAAASSAVDRAAAAVTTEVATRPRRSIEPAAAQRIRPPAEPTTEPVIEPTAVQQPTRRRRITLAGAGTVLAIALVSGIVLITGSGGRASVGAKDHASRASHARAQAPSASLVSHRQSVSAGRPMQGRLHSGTRATSHRPSAAKSSMPTENQASSSASTPPQTTPAPSEASTSPATTPASSPATSALRTTPAGASSPTSTSGAGNAGNKRSSPTYGPTVVSGPVE